MQVTFDLVCVGVHWGKAKNVMGNIVINVIQ